MQKIKQRKMWLFLENCFLGNAFLYNTISGLTVYPYSRN